MVRNLLLLFAFVAALVSPAAFSQSSAAFTLLQPPPSSVWGPYSSYFPGSQTGWVVTNPATTAAVGVTGGAVNVSGSGAARVAIGSTILDIPGAITARVAPSAIATAAGRAAVIARGLAGPVGIALTGYAIYDLVKNSGVKTCPAPDFFCKPQPADVQPATVVGGWFDPSGYPGCQNGKPCGQTPQEVCDWYATSTRFGGPRPRTTKVLTSTTAQCDAPAYGGNPALAGTEAPRTNGGTKSCPPGFHLTFDTLSCEKDNPTLVPATEGDITKAAGDAMAGDDTGTKAKTWFDAVSDANGKISAMGGTPVPPSLMVPAGSTTTVTAPVVNGPNVTTGVRTFTDANGVQQTETTQAQTTVTPQSSGSGSTTNIVYDIKNTTTITTTNNTVNNTTNPPTVVVKSDSTPAVKPSSPTSSTPLPTDYNREATQLSVLEQLKALNGPITATAANGNAELDAIKAQNDLGVAAVAGIDETSTGLRGWFPTIPTAACVDPRVPIPITGGELAVPICEKVDVFSKFISAVICVFALFGCVREVQSALKA